MNKIGYTLLLIAGISIQLCAQSSKVVHKVESGANLEELVSPVQQYLFQDFEDCMVMYNDSSWSRGKMNYNLVVGEMQFFMPKSKEILALSNIEDVASITIAGRVFVPLPKGKEFMEIIVKGINSLAVKRRTVVTPYGKQGAYGTINSTSSVESISAMSYDGRRQDLSVSDYSLIELKTVFYLVIKEKKQQIVGKKTILNAYPKEIRTQIFQFITENKINLKNETDLIKLIKYCNKL